MNKYLARPWHLARRQAGFRKYFAACQAQGSGPKLHVGCGNRPISGWCNIDVAHLTQDVQYVNALKRLPFEDGSFQFIFSEHFIEHLAFEEGLRFFKEAYRVLKTGGVLRTATPDLKFLSSLYSGDSDQKQRYIDYVFENFDGDKPQSPVASINRSFYGWGHRFIYDALFLEKVLAQLGFGNFRTFKPGQSDAPELRGLEQHGKSVPSDINDMETFVLEATKL
ncbi:methyltransferase domain-containing protein [bacterium]|jgi:SAM-dependent methyltransferase|nr:methyltransferase domain-containing protein [bacterium]